jgi:surface polysaccharide O-acyltransferase-like enzyme
MIFHELNIKSKKISQVICYVADKTFYIYLIHYFFVTLLGTKNLARGLDFLPKLIRYVVCAFGIFAISLLIAVVVKEIGKLFRRRSG